MSSCLAGSLALSAQPATLKLVSSTRPPFTNVPGEPRCALGLIETALNRARSTNVSAGTLADLKGRTVAIVGGFSYGDAIDQSGAVFVRSTSEEDSLTRLLQASVDDTLMDELVVDVIAGTLSWKTARRRLATCS